MSEKEQCFYLLIEKLLDDNLSPREEIELDRWLSRSQKYSQHLQKLVHLEIDLLSLQTPRILRQDKTLFPLWIKTLAAVLMIGLVCTGFFVFLNISDKSPLASPTWSCELKRHGLAEYSQTKSWSTGDESLSPHEGDMDLLWPEGAVWTLASNSQLSGKTDRVILQNGKLEVTHPKGTAGLLRFDSPFGDAAVISGTHFVLYSNPENLEKRFTVIVHEGQISLSGSSGNRITLNAGSTASVDSRGIPVKEESNEKQSIPPRPENVYLASYWDVVFSGNILQSVNASTSERIQLQLVYETNYKSLYSSYLKGIKQWGYCPVMSLETPALSSSATVMLTEIKELRLLENISKDLKSVLGIEKYKRAKTHLDDIKRREKPARPAILQKKWDVAARIYSSK